MVRMSRVTLLTGLSALALTAAPAFAQDTPDNDNDGSTDVSATREAQAGNDETIVITGTRRTDRTVADSPVPVDVIGSDQIVNSGQTETAKILNQLVPSFNFPQP